MTFRRHESISSLAFIDPLYIQWGDTRGNTRDALNHWNLCTTGGEEEGRREGDPLRAVSFTFHYGIICHASVDPLSLADHKQPWHKFQLSRITWRRSIDRPATEKFITLKSTDRDVREMRAPPTSVSLLQRSFSFFSFFASTGGVDRFIALRWRRLRRLRRFGSVNWRNEKLDDTLPISILERGVTGSLHERSRFFRGLTWLDKKIWFSRRGIKIVFQNFVQDCASMSCYYVKFRASSWLKYCFLTTSYFLFQFTKHANIYVITICKGS